MNITAATTVYHDPVSGLWIAELRAVGQSEWTRLGVFSTRSDAQHALDDIKPNQNHAARRKPRH